MKECNVGSHLLHGDERAGLGRQQSRLCVWRETSEKCTVLV